MDEMNYNRVTIEKLVPAVIYWEICYTRALLHQNGDAFLPHMLKYFYVTSLNIPVAVTAKMT